MIAEAAAGSVMDEERRVGGGDVHIAARERANPPSISPRLKKHNSEHPSTTNEIPHTTTILAH